MSNQHGYVAYAKDVVTRSPDGEDDDEEVEFLRVPISSTNEDRDGDEFSDKGAEHLRDQIEERSRPVFGNHGMDGGLMSPRYDWKDIIGGLDAAEIETDDDGVSVLNGYIRPNPENEQAQKLVDYVRAGMPVGFSIGFRPLETDEKDTGGMIVHEADLLEVSAVGIQSNRESVATDAADTAATLAKAVGDVDVNGDLDEATLAKAIVEQFYDAGDGEHRNSTPSEWAQKHFSAEGEDDDTPPATRNMGDDSDDTKDTDERLVELLERQNEATDELKDTLDDLSERVDTLAKGEDDDGEDDDDDDEPGEDEDGDDGKSTEPPEGKNRVVVEAEQEDQIKDLLEAADGGEVKLADSETTVTLVDGDEAKNADDTSTKEVF